jgi:hypothetical protein
MNEKELEANEFQRRSELCIDISARILERLYKDIPEDTIEGTITADQLDFMDEAELFIFRANISPDELFDTNEQIIEGLEWSQGIFALIRLAFKGTEIGRIMDDSPTPLLAVLETDYADDFFNRIEKIDPENPDIDIDSALRYIYYCENGDIFRRQLMTDAECEEFKDSKRASINNDRTYLALMLRTQASYAAMVKLIEIRELPITHKYSIFSLDYPDYQLQSDSDLPSLTMHLKAAGVKETVSLLGGQLVSTKTQVIYSAQGGNEQHDHFDSKPVPASDAQRRLALSYLQALVNKFSELEESENSDILDFIHQND